jgi:hypothetical protein
MHTKGARLRHPATTAVPTEQLVDFDQGFAPGGDAASHWDSAHLSLLDHPFTLSACLLVS